MLQLAAMLISSRPITTNLLPQSSHMYHEVRGTDFSETSLGEFLPDYAVSSSWRWRSLSRPWQPQIRYLKTCFWIQMMVSVWCEVFPSEVCIDLGGGAKLPVSAFPNNMRKVIIILYPSLRKSCSPLVECVEMPFGTADLWTWPSRFNSTL